MGNRIIVKAFKSSTVINDGDMRLLRSLPAFNIESLGPFVFLDHYQHQSKRGIGDTSHPHAGIEVISYLLDGSVVHKDSLGNVDTLNAGDSQFIKAGSGMLHKETPQSGRHGLKLWTSLPAKNKFDKPEYFSFKADKIPVIELEGNTIKVIAGNVNGKEGILPVTSPAVLAYIHFKTGHEVTLKIDETFQLGVYVLQGGIMVGVQGPLVKGDIGLLSNGAQINLNPTRDLPADCIVLGGQKIAEPLIFEGPFVMATIENLNLTKRNYA
ncbi:MAG: pirin family protein [Chitinophagaceae bacterium]|nr:MAG: pirin family protein [Chitinophagaceae bacterium]